MNLRSRGPDLSADLTKKDSPLAYPSGSGFPQANEVSNSDEVLSHRILSPPDNDMKARGVSVVLHASRMKEVVGRENEIDILSRSLLRSFTQGRSAVIYVSGAPGTGKTATVTQVVMQLSDCKKCRSLFLNCMQMTSLRAVYVSILERLCKTSVSASTLALEKVVARVEAQLTRVSKRLPLVMVLDELDRLESRHQDALYTVFGWTERLKEANLVVIGIANALDMPERLLPSFSARSLRPVHVIFSPYSVDQLAKIIYSRLRFSDEVSKPPFDELTLQFCAKKVAATSGDVRAALAICRRAIEIARLEARSTGNTDVTPTACRLTSLQRRIMSSPSVRASLRNKYLHSAKFTEDNDEVAAVIPTIRHITQAIRESQSAGSLSMTSADSHSLASGEMPLHHKLVLSACLLLRRLRGLRESTIGQVFDVYSYVCLHRAHLSPLEIDEFIGVCELLDSHGFVRLSAGAQVASFPTPARSKRLSLLLDDKIVECSLNDNLLISSVLSTQDIP